MNDYATIEELLDALGKGSLYNKKPVEFKFKEEGKMSRQMTALDQIRQGGFIIGSVDTEGKISFSPNPIVHYGEQPARTECKRLAIQNPGKAFIFVKLAGAELVPESKPISY